MFSFVDMYSIGLLLVSLGFFVVRYIREEPPVMPYLVIACTCGVSNFMGTAGGMGSIILLIAASFLFVGCLLYPQYRGRARKPAQPDLKPGSGSA